jgi:hypothetical protein
MQYVQTSVRYQSKQSTVQSMVVAVYRNMQAVCYVALHRVDTVDASLCTVH